jgi:geranylgeranyl pyrophosphate synthase
MKWLHDMYGPVLLKFEQSIPTNWQGLQTIAARWTADGIYGLPELVLPIACTRAANGVPEDYLDIYAALVHAIISLRILDDTFDEHQQAELNKAIGDARAVNIAFTFQNLCYRTVAQAPLSPERKAKVVQILADGFFIVNAGQDRDLSQFGTDPESYWATLEMKTAAAYAAVAAVGATLGSDDIHCVEPLARVCQHLGMAIQIWNDYEGVWKGDHPKDLLDNKITLPLIEALHRQHPQQQQLRHWVQSNEIAQQAREIVKVLDSLKIGDIIIQMAWEQNRQAREHLELVQQNAGTEVLKLYLDGMFEDLLPDERSAPADLAEVKPSQRSAPFLLIQREDDRTRIRVIKEQMPEPKEDVKRAPVFTMRDALRQHYS